MSKLYGKVDPTTLKINELIPRPKWYRDNGEEVSDVYLADNYILPVDYNQPEFDPIRQRITMNDKSEWIVHRYTPTEENQEYTREYIEVTYTIEDVPFEEYQQECIELLEAKRWEEMTKGITVPPGIQVGTTIDDQNRLTTVTANAPLAGLTDDSEVDFKALSGFVKVTIGQIKQIVGLIGQHVQACYSAEAAHFNAIQAIDNFDDLISYMENDLNNGWPQ